MKSIIILVFISFSFFTLDAKENSVEKTISNKKVIKFLGEAKPIRNLISIKSADCEFVYCLYADDFHQTLATILKNKFPGLIIKDQYKLLMDLYSPDDKNQFQFGGDEFDKKKNEVLKEDLEEFFESQYFSYLFCPQKINPTYDFESKVFSFRIFESIQEGSHEFMKFMDPIEIPVPEEIAYNLRKNPKQSLVLCKFRLDVQAKTESYGIGLIYQVADPSCGILDLHKNQFYTQPEG